MQITDEHRKTLSEMIHFAFVEIRLLGWGGKSAQAADLADAFHNLPKEMWREDFNLEYFRDAFLKVYQEKHPEGRVQNYVAQINAMLAAGENYQSN